MKMKIPGTPGYKTVAHDSALVRQDQDPNGKVRTFYETHQLGNRKQRRARQQHHAIFTKSLTLGRLFNQKQQRKYGL